MQAYPAYQFSSNSESHLVSFSGIMCLKKYSMLENTSLYSLFMEYLRLSLTSAIYILS